jgi:hypothetical protein
MCLRVSKKKKIWNFLLASLKSLKKGSGSGSAPTCDGFPTLIQAQ